MKVEQITITPDESMLFNIKQESKDENQIDQENSCQDMFDYNDDSESDLVKTESKTESQNDSKNSGFSEETATFSCKHCNENFDEARWAQCALKFLSCEMSQRELKQMEPILNFQVPGEGLELVILLHTQYITLVPHNSLMHHDSQKNVLS